jgi:hypothetical protein
MNYNMSSNKKILAVLLLCIVSSTTVFILFISTSTNDICSIEKQFYLQDWTEPQNKKIIIMGSSHTGTLNNDYINNHLEKNGLNFTSYNLSIGADTPSDRLWSIDNIIDMNPSLVLYGVGWRDLENTDSVQQNRNINSKLLFDPELFFNDLIPLNIHNEICLSSLKSPLSITIGFVRNLLSPNNEVGIQNQFMPFFLHFNYYSLTHSNDELVDHPILLKKYKGFDDSGKNANALKKIITKLKENDIDVILFVTPLSNIYLDNYLPEVNKLDMFYFMDTLKNDYNIKIFYFHDKYKDLNIWADPQHVAYNENTLIYSDDILQIILRETN